MPGKSLAQRSLAGCSPWGCRRVRPNLVTKHRHTQTHTHTTSSSCQDSRHLHSTRVYPLEVLPPALERCFSDLNLCRNSRRVYRNVSPLSEVWGGAQESASLTSSQASVLALSPSTTLGEVRPQLFTTFPRCPLSLPNPVSFTQSFCFCFLLL